MFFICKSMFLTSMEWAELLSDHSPAVVFCPPRHKHFLKNFWKHFYLQKEYYEIRYVCCFICIPLNHDDDVDQFVA